MPHVLSYHYLVDDQGFCSFKHIILQNLAIAITIDDSHCSRHSLVMLCQTCQRLYLIDLLRRAFEKTNWLCLMRSVLCQNLVLCWCKDAGGQAIGFLLGSLGVSVALTSDTCYKGLPKAASGAAITFRGMWQSLNLLKVLHHFYIDLNRCCFSWKSIGGTLAIWCGIFAVTRHVAKGWLATLYMFCWKDLHSSVCHGVKFLRNVDDKC